MNDKQQALNAFWNGFTWKAYDESTVPDNALALNDNRYITYQSGSDNFDGELLLTASLWFRSNSWTAGDLKAEEISRYIELEMPPAIPIKNGFMKIRRGAPFALRQSDENADLRRILINYVVEFLTQY